VPEAGRDLRFSPANAGNWADIETVFRDCGDGSKCWCAYWYLPNREFKAGKGEGNRQWFRRHVAAGAEPGILAFVDGEPAGWLSVAPREKFDRLNRSRSFKPIDDQPVWSMNCFIVREKFRRQGLMRRLIRAGIEFVRGRGGQVIEAYPFEATRKAIPGYDLFVGTAAAFRANGFVEVARPLPTRPVMRLMLE
jgi:GNAT superfamily N-acetyltransferase